MKIHRSDIVDVLRDAWGDRALEMVKTRVRPRRENWVDRLRWAWIEKQLTPTKAELVARATKILACHGIDYNAIQ